MMHPPDPQPQRNVHVSMKVSIMTDGPGGINFHQAVNTPGYSGEQLDPGYGYPYNALGYEGYEPAPNMITWPAGATSETQTEPIIQMPADTTKDSEQDTITEAQPAKSEKAEDDKSKQRHHRHHRHHKRSKSGGGDSRSQSSMSAIKLDLNESREVPSERRSTHSGRHHKSHDGSSRKSRSRPESVQNFEIPILEDERTPKIVPIEDNIFQNLPTTGSRLFPNYLPADVFNKPVQFRPSPSHVSYNPSEESEIKINTFSDDTKIGAGFVPRITTFSDDNRIDPGFVPSRTTGLDTGFQPLYVPIPVSRPLMEPGFEEPHSITIKEISPTDSNISQRIKYPKKQRHHNIYGIHMGVQCDGPPQAQATQTDESVDYSLIHSASAPDFMSVLEPIVKLTEQLAVANMKEKILITEKTETEVNTYTETFINEPPFMAAISPSRRYVTTTTSYSPKLAPLETLINDVGVVSKEIQTEPEKIITGTSMEKVYASSPSKASSIQLSLNESIESTKSSKHSQRSNAKPVPYTIPFETLINDVGVESKEIQTLPEKFNAGTSTTDLKQQESKSRKDGSSRASTKSVGTSSDVTSLKVIHEEPVFSKLSMETDTLSDFSLKVNASSIASSKIDNKKRTGYSPYIQSKEELLYHSQTNVPYPIPIYRESASLSDLSMQVGSGVTSVPTTDEKLYFRDQLKRSEDRVPGGKLSQTRGYVLPPSAAPRHGSATFSDLSVQVGSVITSIPTSDETYYQPEQQIRDENKIPTLASRDKAVSGSTFEDKFYKTQLEPKVPTRILNQQQNQILSHPKFQPRRESATSSDLSVQVGSAITSIPTSDERFYQPEQKTRDENKIPTLASRDKAVSGSTFEEKFYKTRVESKVPTGILRQEQNQILPHLKFQPGRESATPAQAGSGVTFIPSVSEIFCQEAQDLEVVVTLASRDKAVSGPWLLKETNIDDMLDTALSETHSAMDMRAKSVENYAYESATPQDSFDKESESSSTVKTHSVSSKSSNGRSKPLSPMIQQTTASKKPDQVTQLSKQNDDSKDSNKASISSRSPVEQPVIGYDENNTKLFVEHLSSAESSGRQTPIPERLAKHSSHLKQLREDFFTPVINVNTQLQQKPVLNLIKESGAQPITSLEQILQNRLKNIKQSESLPTPQQSVTSPTKSVPLVKPSTAPPLPPPPPPPPPLPPPPPPSVISKIPVPLPEPGTEDDKQLSPDDTLDNLKYREYIVQHRLPSARIFEMYTKGPTILQYTKSPRSSPNNFTNRGGTYKTIPEESDQQSSVDDDRSSISGQVHKSGAYTILDVKEITNVERNSDYGEQQSMTNTFSALLDSNYDSTLSKDSVISMTSNKVDRNFPTYEVYRRSVIPISSTKVPFRPGSGLSPGSIESERSSLSGMMQRGPVTSSQGYTDENLSDYLQDQCSPVGRLTDSVNSYGNETPTGNSVASITSLRADKSHEMFSPMPETVETPQKEKSFAEIMRSTNIYVIDRLSSKLETVNEAPNESRSRSSTKTFTNDGSSIDHEESGIYAIKPNQRQSSDMLDDESSTMDEENFKDYTQGRISPMLDTNMDSRTSTLTSYGDYEREQIRTAQLAHRPSLNLSREGIYQGQGVENQLTVYNVPQAKVTTVIEEISVEEKQITRVPNNMARKPPMQTEL